MCLTRAKLTKDASPVEIVVEIKDDFSQPFQKDNGEGLEGGKKNLFVKVVTNIFDKERRREYLNSIVVKVHKLSYDAMQKGFKLKIMRRRRNLRNNKIFGIFSSITFNGHTP